MRTPQTNGGRRLRRGREPSTFAVVRAKPIGVYGAKVPKWGNTGDYLAIHYLGVTGENHDLDSDGCGAHYYIYKDGTIYQRCSHNAIVYQVGTAGMYTQKHPTARNANTIGIELCCNCDGNSKSAEDPKWWFQILIAGATIYGMYFYRHYAENWGYADALYLCMAGIGFLIPHKILLSSSQNRGWLSLVMILISVFCYTALTTVKDRLLWGPVIPEHPDMELMMETILVNAEPLMVIITTYFVAQFAFSEIGQILGSQVWFRGIVAVPCLYAFLGYLSRLITQRLFFVAINYVYFSPLMWFIVQPVTIYLVVFLFRLIREHRKRKEDRVSWKELAKL